MLDTRQTLALLTALVVLVGSGFAFSRYQRGLEDGAGGAVLPPGALGRVPLDLPGWRGLDVPMDPEILRAADTQAHLNRNYVAKGGSGAVSLWLAYGVRARDLLPHRPEVCMPTHGWNRVDVKREHFDLPDGTRLDYRLLRFAKGGLGTDEMLVLNYYIVDGQYAADESALRDKAGRGQGGIRYMAQIQVAADRNALRPLESVERAVRDFAREAAPHIRAVMPDAAAQAVQP